MGVSAASGVWRLSCESLAMAAFINGWLGWRNGRQLLAKAKAVKSSGAGEKSAGEKQAGGAQAKISGVKMAKKKYVGGSGGEIMNGGRKCNEMMA